VSFALRGCGWVPHGLAELPRNERGVESEGDAVHLFIIVPLKGCHVFPAPHPKGNTGAAGVRGGGNVSEVHGHGHLAAPPQRKHKLASVPQQVYRGTSTTCHATHAEMKCGKHYHGSSTTALSTLALAHSRGAAPTLQPRSHALHHAGDASQLFRQGPTGRWFWGGGQ
jgi:hypothetical protein